MVAEAKADLIPGTPVDSESDLITRAQIAKVIELDDDIAAERKRSRERWLHTRDLPRLRLLGFCIMLVGLAGHEVFIAP
ncbi:MAG: hypothetical protein AAF417_23275, partial [Pseudomonadota bacterium]